MKIKKVAQTPGVLATVSTSKIDSDKDTYSCNYLNDNAVVVSPTEPSDGKVWIQTGKNLLNIDNVYKGYYSYNDEGTIFSGNSYAVFDKIKVKPNTTYTYSRIADNSVYSQLRYVEFDENKNFISRSAAAMDLDNEIGYITFTTSENTHYVAIMNFNGNSAALFSDLSNIQLEQGDKTPYEPYIPKKIHTNTGNGYAEFYNEENGEVYATEEQRIGTYLGKPLYRKTYIGTTDVLLKYGVYVFRAFPYIDKLVSHKGFITFVDSEKTFVHEIGCYESDIHFSGIQLYKDGGDLRIFGGDGYAIGSTYDLTIEYTKTTD